MGKLSRVKKERKLYKPEIIKAYKVYETEQKVKRPEILKKGFKAANNRKVYKTFIGQRNV